jgi:eukaryotic-like serine/threonine-protein kinase
MAAQGRIGCMSRGHGLRPLHPALARYGSRGAAMLSGPADPPFASINYGAAGIAYAIYRLALGGGGVLALADTWVHKASVLSSLAKAYDDPDEGISSETAGEVSLFHSACGLHCIDALVALALGDVGRAARAIQAFVNATRTPSDNPDATLGTASLLLGCAELLESAPDSSPLDLDPLRTRGDEIAAALSEILLREQIAASTRIRFLGVAHGWAGLLFALLRWTRAMRRSVPPLLAAKLDELASLAIPYRDGVCWTVHNHSSSLMPGWCHGTAGYTMLFALAHEIMPQVPAYADLAERAAASCWNIHTPNSSLCCGNGGNGYAFLAAYRLTGAPVWLERAHATARRASRHASKFPFRDSLYKGALGVALLRIELDRPATAAMPLFEPVRPNTEVGA